MSLIADGHEIGSF